MEERLGDIGDLKERLNLRKSLNCKSFEWYWNEIVQNKLHVQKKLPTYGLIGAGEIRNAALELCFDKDDHVDHMDEPIDLKPCHSLGRYQYWWLKYNKG